MNTNAFGTLYRSNGKIENISFESNQVTVKELQDCVGGHFEFVYLRDAKIMVVNEEGKLNNLPVNYQATLIARTVINDFIVGDVLVIENKFVD